MKRFDDCHVVLAQCRHHVPDGQRDGQTELLPVTVKRLLSYLLTYVRWNKLAILKHIILHFNLLYHVVSYRPANNLARGTVASDDDATVSR